MDFRWFSIHFFLDGTSHIQACALAAAVRARFLANMDQIDHKRLKNIENSP